VSDGAEPWQARVARVLDSVSRWSLWGIALFVLVVIPWFFGGMGPEGYWFTVWAGRACLLPLGLWAVSSILIRRKPPMGFWVAVGCWGLLAAQILVSMENKCQVPEPPWVSRGFVPVEYNAWLPTTAFKGATQALGRLWFSYGVFAITAFSVGMRPRWFKALSWIFVLNVAVLAGLGIPFKYSGDYLMLGRWPVQESYFYSTFYYHNHWCAYALLGLATGVGLCLACSQFWVRALLVCLTGVILASAPISVSRLGSLLMFGFVCWVMLPRVRQLLLARGAVLWRQVVLVCCGLAVLGSICLLVVFLNRTGPGTVGQRTWSYIIKANPIGSRIFLVQDSMPMVLEKPVFGWGLGAFGAGFRKFQRPETIVVFNEGRETRYEHCHNDWMERWVELGCLGFILMAAPVLYWLNDLRRKCILPVDPLLYWTLAGLGVLWLFAVGDMVFDNRSVAGIAALLTGLLPQMMTRRSGKS